MLMKHTILDKFYCFDDGLRNLKPVCEITKENFLAEFDVLTATRFIL
jgi:hypothetical protein